MKKVIIGCILFFFSLGGVSTAFAQDNPFIKVESSDEAPLLMQSHNNYSELYILKNQEKYRNKINKAIHISTDVGYLYAIIYNNFTKIDYYLFREKYGNPMVGTENFDKNALGGKMKLGMRNDGSVFLEYKKVGLKRHIFFVGSNSMGNSYSSNFNDYNISIDLDDSKNSYSYYCSSFGEKNKSYCFTSNFGGVKMHVATYPTDGNSYSAISDSYELSFTGPTIISDANHYAYNFIIDSENNLYYSEYNKDASQYATYRLNLNTRKKVYQNDFYLYNIFQNVDDQESFSFFNSDDSMKYSIGPFYNILIDDKKINNEFWQFFFIDNVETSQYDEYKTLLLESYELPIGGHSDSSGEGSNGSNTSTGSGGVTVNITTPPPTVNVNIPEQKDYSGFLGGIRQAIDGIGGFLSSVGEVIGNAVNGVKNSIDDLRLFLYDFFNVTGEPGTTINSGAIDSIDTTGGFNFDNLSNVDTTGNGIINIDYEGKTINNPVSLGHNKCKVFNENNLTFLYYSNGNTAVNFSFKSFNLLDNRFGGFLDFISGLFIGPVNNIIGITGTFVPFYFDNQQVCLFGEIKTVAFHKMMKDTEYYGTMTIFDYIVLFAFSGTLFFLLGGFTFLKGTVYPSTDFKPNKKNPNEIQ